MGMDNKMIQTTREVVPVIYAYTTPEIARHDGWTKIGDTGRETGKRLDEQMLTSDVRYNLEWKANAIYEGTNETFRDKDFHAYMQKQGIERLKGTNYKGKEVDLEWFKIKPQDAKMMLYDFRADKGVLKAYQDRFGELPSAENIKKIAEIISWNLWQMDGLKDTVPFGIPDDDFQQITLFDEATDKNKPVYCKIQDWHSCEDRIIEYRTMKGSK